MCHSHIGIIYFPFYLFYCCHFSTAVTSVLFLYYWRIEDKQILLYCLRLLAGSRAFPLYYFIFDLPYMFHVCDAFVFLLWTDISYYLSFIPHLSCFRCSMIKIYRIFSCKQVTKHWENSSSLHECRIQWTSLLVDEDHSPSSGAKLSLAKSNSFRILLFCFVFSSPWLYFD